MLNDKSVDKIAGALRPDLENARQRFAIHAQAMTRALKRFGQTRTALDDIYIFGNLDGIPGEPWDRPPNIQKAVVALQTLFNGELSNAVKKLETEVAVGVNTYPSYAFMGIQDGQVGRLYLVDEDKIKDPRYATLDAMDDRKLSAQDRAALRAICEAHAISSRTFIVDEVGEFDAKWKDFVRKESRRTFQEHLFPALTRYHEQEMEMRNIYFRCLKAHMDFVKLCERARFRLHTYSDKLHWFWHRNPEMRVFSQHDPTLGQATIRYFSSILQT